MFISHEDVLWSKSGDLADPAWCLKIVKRLKPKCADGWEPGMDPLERNPCTMLITCLKQLPSFEQIRKIGNKLHEIAAPRDADILRLRWWDIGTSKRHLEVLLHRLAGSPHATHGPASADTRDVVVLLMWKKSDVAANEPRRFAGLSTIRPSWTFDRAAPGGWRFEIECEIFEHIKGAFDRWLASPLLPFSRHG